ncbi:MAG: hypothetical protein ACOCVF_02715 [bacterium]
MGKGKYEVIFREFMIVMAAEIYENTGIKCSYKLDDNSDFISAGIQYTNNKSEWIINFVEGKRTEREVLFKLMLYKLFANYGKITAKDLVLNSKPVVDKAIKTESIMTKEAFKKSMVEPVLPRNLGMKKVDVDKMINEVNNFLIDETSNVNFNVGSSFWVDATEKDWNASIIKEYFEKTGCWKVTTSSNTYGEIYYIFQVLKP